MGMNFSKTINNTKQSILGQRLAKSTIGKHFTEGVLQNYGFEFENGKRTFLGFDTSTGFKGAKAEFMAARSAGQMGSFVSKRAFAGLGLLWSGYSIYQGFQEGGITGAVKRAGEEALTAGAFNVGLKLAGGLVNPWAIGAATAVGIGMSGYQVGESARANGKRIRNLEMGGEVMDRFGTIATMRQRSLQALQNSHLNGRMALGNEAALIHNPARMR
jgi:hypothetical protein